MSTLYAAGVVAGVLLLAFGGWWTWNVRADRQAAAWVAAELPPELDWTPTELLAMPPAEEDPAEITAEIPVVTWPDTEHEQPDVVYGQHSGRFERAALADYIARHRLPDPGVTR